MAPLNKARVFWFSLGSLTVLGSGLVVATVRAAGAPEGAGALTYSGRLESAEGEPLNGPRNIGLAVYSAATAGTRTCEVPSAEIEIVQGRFSVTLPAACATAVHGNPNLWIEVQVDGASLGRAKIGAVPYALEAAHAAAAAQATRATTAAGVTLHAENISASDDAVLGGTFASSCIASVNANFLGCVIAAKRKCQNLGYANGWFTAESANGTLRSIVCVK